MESEICCLHTGSVEQNSGNFALHLIILAKRMDILILFLKNGAQLNLKQQCKNGKTAFELAYEQFGLEETQKLINHKTAADYSSYQQFLDNERARLNPNTSLQMRVQADGEVLVDIHPITNNPATFYAQNTAAQAPAAPQNVQPSPGFK